MGDLSISTDRRSTHVMHGGLSLLGRLPATSLASETAFRRAPSIIGRGRNRAFRAQARNFRTLESELITAVDTSNKRDS